jgi:hypothetical protein
MMRKLHAPPPFLPLWCVGNVSVLRLCGGVHANGCAALLLDREALTAGRNNVQTAACCCPWSDLGVVCHSARHSVNLRWRCAACVLLLLLLLQSVLAGEKLAPALLDFAQRSSKQQPKPEEGAEVAAAPAAAALDDQ